MFLFSFFCLTFAPGSLLETIYRIQMGDAEWRGDSTVANMKIWQPAYVTASNAMHFDQASASKSLPLVCVLISAIRKVQEM